MSNGDLDALYPKRRPRRNVGYGIPRVLGCFYGFWNTVLHRRLAPRTRMEQVGTLRLEIRPGVFNPKAFLTSPTLIPLIDRAGVAPGARWLELGTGCGLGAIHAACCGANVVATDINAASVDCAAANAARLGVAERVVCRAGDLFAPVTGECFDVVLFHPPYFSGEQTDPHTTAFCHADLPKRFAAGLGVHLRPGGVALLLLSGSGDCEAYLSALKLAGYRFEILVERELIVELVLGYRVFRGEAA